MIFIYNIEHLHIKIYLFLKAIYIEFFSCYTMILNLLLTYCIPWLSIGSLATSSEVCICSGSPLSIASDNFNSCLYMLPRPFLFLSLFLY